MIPAPFIAALNAFDEAALTLLANKGLMMRAQRDLGDGKATIADFDGKVAQVLVDGETVSLDARGPRAASCTCPAPGMCRHRLAATLAIQAASPSQGDTKAPAAVGEPTPVAIDFEAEIRALTPQIIAKWTGKAAWRGALDLAAEGDAKVTQTANALVVNFGDEKGDIRIVAGQGLDGIVSKVSPALKKAYHSAAIIAARIHFGIIDAEPAASSSERQEAVETKAINADFLAAVSQALSECANVALNIAPISLEERLFTLAVSSRADALPRLGAMLRALSKMMRTRRNRDFTFDPDACLELMADAYALVVALARAQDRLDEAKQTILKGKSRQDYNPIGDVTLVGCGADQWRTTGGARGITGYFYDPTHDRWHSASVARAAGQDPLFDPAHAYKSEAIWQSGALEKLSVRSFLLKNAAASLSGRLSMAKGIEAKLNLHDGDPKRTSWPCYLTNWDKLGERLEARLTGGLATARTVTEPVILAPGRLSRPVFDDLSQTLSWAVEDDEGVWLSLSLDHDGDRGSAIMTALEKMTDGGWTGAIVALASVDGGQYVLRPFALLDKDKVISLGLDPLPEPKKSVFGGFAGRLVSDLAEKFGRLPKQFIALPKSATQLLLSICWQRLLEMSEIGLSLGREKSVAQIRDCARRLTDAGLPNLGEAMAHVYGEGKPTPSHYFHACYMVRLAQRTMIYLPVVRPVA